MLPMIEAGYYSFFNWNGYGTPTDFVGLRNYEQLIGQKIFHSALWNNVLVVAVSLAGATSSGYDHGSDRSGKDAG